MLNFIKKYYLLILAITLLISYGQTLFMLPWQDDNALFFKLAHIRENAGFMGPEISGEGPYKYTAMFYYPISLFFGYQPVFYFTFGLLLYGFSTLVIYKVASKILNENSGMLAGFLYAAGFIGSDSFIRLFNSVITSISVTLVTVFIYVYWRFYKDKKIFWYLFSVGLFFLAGEFARARTHYLIAVPIVFEAIFLAFKKTILKSFLFSLVRVIPFLPFFYWYVILGDFRSRGALDFAASILNGQYHKMYGFLSTVTHMVLPAWFVRYLSPSPDSPWTQSYLSGGAFVLVGLLLISVIFSVFVIIKYKNARVPTLIFLVLSILWRITSSRIFDSPELLATQEQLSVAFMGGELMLLAALGFFIIGKKTRFLYLFFLTGTLVNMLSYSAYNPLQVYEKINRYLSHSFVFMVILLTVIYYSIRNKKTKLIVLIMIIAWGLGNVAESFFYQRQVLTQRAFPVKSFYNQLEMYLPVVLTGDILYFDLEDSMRGKFADAFSVAQMPDTTAIAWRYDIDRDDFRMFQEPEDFFDYLDSHKIESSSLHTFFYSKNGLINTTEQLKSMLGGKKPIDLEGGGVGVKIPSLIPFKLLVEIRGIPLNADIFKFPLGNSPVNKNFIDLAFNYKKFREEFRKKQVTATSSWQKRDVENLTDGDIDSIWEADRLLWLKEEQYLTINLTDGVGYGGIAFINSFSDHTPLEFDVLFSFDGSNWEKIKTFENSRRYENGELVFVDFKPQKIGYLRIHFKKTLNGDAPAISEIWAVPSKFSDTDVSLLEKFILNPFANIESAEIYDYLIKKSEYKGMVEVLWTNNKNFGWQKSAESYADVIFDGKGRLYEIPILPGGTFIDNFKFSAIDFPGEVEVNLRKSVY